jgi:hypothetical protein
MHWYRNARRPQLRLHNNAQLPIVSVLTNHIAIFTLSTLLCIVVELQSITGVVFRDNDTLSENFYLDQHCTLTLVVRQKQAVGFVARSPGIDSFVVDCSFC